MAAVRRRTAPTYLTASAHLTVTPVFIPTASAVATTWPLTIPGEDGAGTNLARLVNVIVLASYLLLVIAVVLPAAETRLWQVQQQLQNDYIAMFGL
jgi:hypothetical protein